MPGNVAPLPVTPVPLFWTCSVCHQVHPIDHAGLFCGVCFDMAACVSCEREFRGQCHGGPDAV